MMMFLRLILFLAVAVDPIFAQNYRQGDWGDVFDMQVIPIHAAVLSDGQILAYGSDRKGFQGGSKDYEIWDTRSGNHESLSDHNLYNHSTNVDIFCSSMALDVSTGNFLIIGGDDNENNGVKDVLEFNTVTHQIRRHPKGNMKYARWYGSSVNLPNGRVFVVGGKSGNRTEKMQSPVPEIWGPRRGFRELPNAEVPDIGRTRKLFRTRAWWYPHTYVNSSGDIIVILGHGSNTAVYRIGVEGRGRIEQIGTKPFNSDKLGPSIMYDVDKVIMLDSDGVLWSVDISNSSSPIFERKRNAGRPRANGAMALLPDGRVAISGGNRSGEKFGNNLRLAVHSIQIWNPLSNRVVTGPKQDNARLYHSSSLILPDGTVFSGGGGAPGPMRNRNGQIYMPPYLFNPETGAPASRPVIEYCPHSAEAGSTIIINVKDALSITRVTATKSGSMTHARNNDARWVELSFSLMYPQSMNPSHLEVPLPNKNIFIPGLWNINVIDEKGVPSVACLVAVNMKQASRRIR